mmetsp:Transcript_2930/g.9880  ORF Transcript_2930/g.9880 Transcript_2930/m.9880 type:complete len:211 (+) Transcript_2930:1824-2456(+)
MVQHRLVEVRLDFDVDSDGCLKVVVALQADVWFHDGHETFTLADKSIASKVLHVRANREVRNVAILDHQRASPLGESRARLVVGAAAGAEGVEALHDRRTASARKSRDLEVRLHPRHDPLGHEQRRERFAGVAALKDGLGVQDSSTEIVRAHGIGEEHLAIKSSILFCVDNTHFLKSVSNRSGPLIACRNALPGASDEFSSLSQSFLLFY